MYYLTLLLSLLLTTQSFAQTVCPAYLMVKAGDQSPCSGIFLNQSTNEMVKKDLRDNELRKKQIELKDLQLTELKSDRDNWKSEAEKQAIIRHSKDSDLRNGVIAGVIATLAVMFVVRKVGK